MKFTSVVLPITAGQRIDERYDAILNWLNEHECALHLLVVTDQFPSGEPLPPSLTQHGAQLQRLTTGLYHEALDAIVRTLEKRFKNLSFHIHIQWGDSVHAIQGLLSDVQGDLLLCDGKHKDRLTHNRDNNGLFQVLHRLSVPMLVVATRPHKMQSVTTMLDPKMLTQQPAVGQYLRWSRNVAQQLDCTFTIETPWQWQGEDFLTNWLQLNELDVARYVKTARQQFNSKLMTIIESALDQYDQSINVVISEPIKTATATVSEAERHEVIILALDTLSPIWDDTYQFIDTCDQTFFVAPLNLLGHDSLSHHRKKIASFQETAN